MASSNWTDKGHLAPPSKRNTPSAAQPTIVIEPLPEYQRFYNQTRQELDRQRLQLHVTEENSLEPPQAQPMSRSTTGSDSLPSPSTVYSHAGDSNAPLSPDPLNEVTRSKPHRGKRRGPLDPETRIKTAFKRKFKLPCDFHRAKRTSCNCYDFSRLEEGYLQTLRPRERDTRASEGHSANSFGELGTFGTGGAGDAALAAHLSYPSFDLPGSSTGHETDPPAALLPILNFNIHSQASVDEIRSASRRDMVFLPPAAFMPIPTQAATDDIVPIGCSTQYRTRWECKFQCPPGDTRSLPSADSCTWTGPFEQLCAHFHNEHHPFQQAVVAKWSQCLQCSASAIDWTDTRTCQDPTQCRPESWRKWFFGAPQRQEGLNPGGLTVSEPSGSRSSWFDPPWNMTTPGSNNTEQTNFRYNASTDRTSFYEHSSCGNENNEADCSEDEDDPYHHECAALGAGFRCQDGGRGLNTPCAILTNTHDPLRSRPLA
ncbi:hypothetical protein O1611_g4273 [Lasiodiplodia mahajangana]|uniref:Uncharacterized protein n=1 Tax=Lasiodiplodia mahajangana TaxID=1108764 RepID=A0ACC2JQ30_9PEZI|nr:hypothetical protein O1611_g4273 [Lasiodiplodia mahajangana]